MLVAAQNRGDGVTQCRQKLRRATAGDRAGVFAKTHVPHAMEVVFNRPVITRQLKQGFRICVQPRKTGDKANCLGTDDALDDPLAVNASDLFGAGEVKHGWKTRQRFNAAFVHPSVPLVDALSRAQIG